ncbi:hypothetical protein THRCLA_20556 [Thraustotheca clavata]|uniref:Uncharacterized protein n=1 Tax=Thraustotheca clavata TaxID=74557 RepID=A0A1W0A5X3_9STRA|nr:hypothetical protein THRCLA_20556 [Thraustotheca clavata]
MQLVCVYLTRFIELFYSAIYTTLCYKKLTSCLGDHITLAQTYRASLDRTCSYKNMDLELHCTSAEIEIGIALRVTSALWIGFSCVAFCYSLEPFVYILDKPSAFLAGILSLETQRYLHIFDTKSWRYIAVPISLTRKGDEKLHGMPLSQF